MNGLSFSHQFLSLVGSQNLIESAYCIDSRATINPTTERKRFDRRANMLLKVSDSPENGTISQAASGELPIPALE
ncbi:MAG: hypothetical protein AB2551_06570 [Candidatus Thiodiazotropha sp.]